MISDTAIVDKKAKIGPNVTISHYAVIGPDVEIGEGTWIGPHAVIMGPTKIGKYNKIYQFASIGEEPQDKKFDGEETTLTVGDYNVFREFTTISRGTKHGGGKTIIGDHNFFMAYVHIAHDCIVGNHTTFSNNASLAGHVIVQDHANLGGFVGVHQFCLIGQHSFCAGGSIIVKDVLPYITVSGHPAQVFGINVEGLKRSEFSADKITQLKRAYKTIYRQGLTLDNAVQKLKEMTTDCVDVNNFVEFIEHSKRGITR